MQVVLAMFRSDGERRSFSLHKETTIVGRREDCDLRIPLGEISRKHCRIIQEDDGLRIEDLGSSNGTYHNGQRVQEAHVQAGDTVQVGSIAFVVQIDGAPADDELQPVLFHSTTPNAEDSSTGEAGTGADSVTGEPAAKESADSGDFDPMAFLQGGDSQVGESNPDADIDVEESSHGHNAEA